MTTYFCMFGERVFQQTVGMHMGTDCAPLLADFYSFIRMRQTSKQGFLKKNEKKLA